MPIITPEASTQAVDLTPLTDRIKTVEETIADIKPYDDKAVKDRITTVEEAIGEVIIFSSTAQTWLTTLKAGEAVQYLSSSGNTQTLTINGLPETLTEIWVAGRKQKVAATLIIRDCRRAIARILGSSLIVETDWKESNLIWSSESTAATIYSSSVPGLPNLREALRRWKFRVQFVLSAPTTGSQFLIDAATNPLSNYVGPNGVEIVAEPTLDLLRFTPLGGAETYSSAQVEPGKIIPLGTYVSWIVGGELFLVQTASLAQPSSSYDASWIVDPKWFDSVGTPATSRYTRSLYSGFTTLTSLSLEYRDNTGTIQTFSLTDFTTGFTNNSFWNTPQGVTRLVPAGVGQVNIAIVLENNNRDITIAVQDLAVTSTLPTRWLQFRNVVFNGRYADNLFGDAAIAANATLINAHTASIAANTTAIAAIRVPTVTNFPVNTTSTTYYTPSSAGVTRTGGVARPPANVTDFCTYDANWDSEVELPVAAAAGQQLTVRNDATRAFSLRSLNTNMSAAITINTNRSIHFVSNANGVWRWIEAPFRTKPSVAAKTTTANAGTAVEFGGIQLRIPASGNRSIQVLSNSGATLGISSRSIHFNGGEAAQSSQTIGTATWAYLNSGWNFANPGEWERSFIRDDTNKRMYDITMVVGSSFNGNLFACIELPHST